jgi:hypothetical protein
LCRFRLVWLRGERHVDRGIPVVEDDQRGDSDDASCERRPESERCGATALFSRAIAHDTPPFHCVKGWATRVRGAVLEADEDAAVEAGAGLGVAETGESAVDAVVDCVRGGMGVLRVHA